MSTTSEGRPPLRRAAAALVGLEAAALVGVGAWTAADALASGAPTAMALAVAAMAVGMGAVLGLASRSLWRGATWPRGLSVTWQVLQAAAGATVLEWSLAAGVAAIAVAVGAGIVLLADARRGFAQDASTVS